MLFTACAGANPGAIRSAAGDRHFECREDPGDGSEIARPIRGGRRYSAGLLVPLCKAFLTEKAKKQTNKTNKQTKKQTNRKHLKFMGHTTQLRSMARVFSSG